MIVGRGEGSEVGSRVGGGVSLTVGGGVFLIVGCGEGSRVGHGVGFGVGLRVGLGVGLLVGSSDGFHVGSSVGVAVTCLHMVYAKHDCWPSHSSALPVGQGFEQFAFASSYEVPQKKDIRSAQGVLPKHFKPRGQSAGPFGHGTPHI